MAEVISEFGYDVHEAEESISFSSSSSNRIWVGAEVVVQGSKQLIHALHISKARVELCKYEQRTLHFLHRQCTPSHQALWMWQAALGTCL